AYWVLPSDATTREPGSVPTFSLGSIAGSAVGGGPPPEPGAVAVVRVARGPLLDVFLTPSAASILNVKVRPGMLVAEAWYGPVPAVVPSSAILCDPSNTMKRTTPTLSVTSAFQEIWIRDPASVNATLLPSPQLGGSESVKLAPERISPGHGTLIGVGGGV